MSVKVAVGERHMRPTFKMTPMTRECPRAWKRMEKWRERRLAVRALGIRTVIGRRGIRRPVPVERDCRVPLFEDVVETPRFSKERVRLRDWCLLVGVAVHLEGRLRFVRKGSTPLAERVRGKGRGAAQTSPYSFVSQMSKRGRRLPSCSLQRTTGCIVPKTPLNETEALSSRFAALVFVAEALASVSTAGSRNRRKGRTG